MGKKLHIEKNTVQETLVIPLYARQKCTELFPTLYHDTAARPIDSIDYDFSGNEAKAGSLMQRFGFLEEAEIKDVDAYFTVSDAAAELGSWSPLISASSRGYMLGYSELKNPSVSRFFRLLARAGDGIMKMQIVRLDFAD